MASKSTRQNEQDNLGETEQARVEMVIHMVQNGDKDGAAALYESLSPDGQIEYWCGTALHLERELARLRETGAFLTEETERMARHVDQMPPDKRKELATYIADIPLPAPPSVVLPREGAPPQPKKKRSNVIQFPRP